ncbi:universal stress protein [Streptomyces sp. NPDC088789]|uniref:universal stress protein n=1 Tax=Streptomyces sp. NPDC088789 TaxID=3365899 RepID=UPI0038176EBE
MNTTVVGVPRGRDEREYLPVVVGVDGSGPGLRAVDRAADEAALRGVDLRVVYASLWERYEGKALADALGGPADEVLGEKVVQVAVRRARDRRPALRVSAGTVPEEPGYVLVRESRNACLLVLGSRGRGALTEALLGSVALTVAGHAHCPLIVVRGDDHDTRSRPRIVVGVGEPFAGSAAVRFAVDEARRRGAVLEAVRAWRHPARGGPDPARPDEESAHRCERRAWEALEEALRGVPAGMEVRRRAVEGSARTVLVDAAHGAGLLVVGARRRPRTFGLQLGRVAHRALHHADCPVAVVPERG